MSAEQRGASVPPVDRRVTGVIGALDEAAAFKRDVARNEVSEALGREGSIDAAIWPGEANAVARAAVGVVGLLFQEGKQFVVVGERRYAVEDLCSHGLMSLSDAVDLAHIAKYLRVVAADVQRAKASARR
jgi:hypothetical protein